VPCVRRRLLSLEPCSFYVRRNANCTGAADAAVRSPKGETQSILEVLETSDGRRPFLQSLLS